MRWDSDGVGCGEDEGPVTQCLSLCISLSALWFLQTDARGSLCADSLYAKSMFCCNPRLCLQASRWERKSQLHHVFCCFFGFFLNHTFPRYLDPGSHWSVLAVRFANNQGQSLSGPLAAHLWAIIWAGERSRLLSVLFGLAVIYVPMMAPQSVSKNCTSLLLHLKQYESFCKNIYKNGPSTSNCLRGPKIFFFIRF